MQQMPQSRREQPPDQDAQAQCAFSSVATVRESPRSRSEDSERYRMNLFRLSYPMVLGDSTS
jgi:hypothetical protein